MPAIATNKQQLVAIRKQRLKINKLREEEFKNIIDRYKG